MERKFKKEEKIGEESYLDLEMYSLHSLENFESMIKSFKADGADHIEVTVDKSWCGEYINGISFTPCKAELETEEEMEARIQKEEEDWQNRQKERELKELKRLLGLYGK